MSFFVTENTRHTAALDIGKLRENSSSSSANKSAISTSARNPLLADNEAESIAATLDVLTTAYRQLLGNFEKFGKASEAPSEEVAFFTAKLGTFLENKNITAQDVKTIKTHADAFTTFLNKRLEKCEKNEACLRNIFRDLEEDSNKSKEDIRTGHPGCEPSGPNNKLAAGYRSWTLNVFELLDKLKYVIIIAGIYAFFNYVFPQIEGFVSCVGTHVDNSERSYFSKFSKTDISQCFTSQEKGIMYLLPAWMNASVALGLSLRFGSYFISSRGNGTDPMLALVSSTASVVELCLQIQNQYDTVTNANGTAAASAVGAIIGTQLPVAGLAVAALGKNYFATKQNEQNLQFQISKSTITGNPDGLNNEVDRQVKARLDEQASQQQKMIFMLEQLSAKSAKSRDLPALTAADPLRLKSAEEVGES